MDEEPRANWSDFVTVKRSGLTLPLFTHRKRNSPQLASLAGGLRDCAIARFRLSDVQGARTLPLHRALADRKNKRMIFLAINSRER
jgi:hypothetical protein